MLVWDFYLCDHADSFASKVSMSLIAGAHFKSRVGIHQGYVFHQNKHVPKTGTNPSEQWASTLRNGRNQKCVHWKIGRSNQPCNCAIGKWSTWLFLELVAHIMCYNIIHGDTAPKDRHPIWPARLWLLGAEVPLLQELNRLITTPVTANASKKIQKSM